MTYSEARANLNEIAAKNMAAGDSLRVVKMGASNALAVLDGMQAQYGPIVAAIKAEADNNTGDPAWTVAAAEADLVVADFLAHNSTAGDMVDALDEFDV